MDGHDYPIPLDKLNLRVKNEPAWPMTGKSTSTSALLLDKQNRVNTRGDKLGPLYMLATK